MRTDLLLRLFLCFTIATPLMVLAQEPGSILVVNSENLDTYWINEKKVAPEYPTKSLRKGEEGCVAVGFIIEADGTTSAHRAITFHPSNNFTQSAIRAAKQFRYIPSEQNAGRNAVFTTNSFTFQISSRKKFDEQKQQRLAEICTAAANKALNVDTSNAGAG